jgi:hypothetical protein
MAKQKVRFCKAGSKKSRAELRFTKSTQEGTQQPVNMDSMQTVLVYGTSGITKTTKNGKADPLQKVLQKIDAMPLSKWLRQCEAIPYESL